MERSESIKNLACALSKFQREAGKIKKGETNPFFKSRYASLANILDAIMEPLTSNGLSVSQFPSGENGLTTILMHDSGEFIAETYFMKPVKNDPQSLGSSITYQRRYSLGAILGLNIDDDDDGNKASGLKNETKTASGQKPDDTKKPLFDRRNEDLVNHLCDRVTGQNLAGKNPNLQKWTLAQFECNLKGFTKEDYGWLINRATGCIPQNQ